MLKFRKKSIVIEAIQWTGKNIEEVDKFLDYQEGQDGVSFIMGDRVQIETLEGTMQGTINDWIIKGVKGECYPCKPDTFEMTYEALA